MPLLAQWVRQRPWLAAGIAGAAGGIAGIAHGFTAMASTASALAFGGISTKRQSSEHPFRTRVLRTLERSWTVLSRIAARIKCCKRNPSTSS